MAGQRVLNVKRAPKALNVLGGVRTGDALPARVCGPVFFHAKVFPVGLHKSSFQKSRFFLELPRLSRGTAREPARRGRRPTTWPRDFQTQIPPDTRASGNSRECGWKEFVLSARCTGPRVTRPPLLPGADCGGKSMAGSNLFF